MRKFIQKVLAKQAKRKMEKQKPAVVGITGSVGKSSAKQAVGAVLKRAFKVGVNLKNYNNEVGVPLTVLRLPSGGRSAWRWFGILAKGCWRSWRRDKAYPEILVLEMAADQPGDITYLADIARPDVAVVTAVGESHLENFGSVENIVKEKQVLIQRLAKDGAAILNRDDERVWAMREKSKVPVTGFGFHDESDVRAHDVSMVFKDGAGGECGMQFKISARGSTIPVFLPGVLGRQAIYAALAAAAVGLVKGMNLVEIAEGLRDYEPPPGRTRCLTGIKRTLLIDDTYNAAPRSMRAALQILRDLPADTPRRKFAVLGDMLELGSASVPGHEEAGRTAVECGVDHLILVGERMGDAKKAAVAAGFPAERINHFGSTDDAGRFVQEMLKQGDVVLVKGSRGMHMDRVVKELMADPLLAERLLVDYHE